MRYIDLFRISSPLKSPVWFTAQITVLCISWCIGIFVAAPLFAEFYRFIGSLLGA